MKSLLKKIQYWFHPKYAIMNHQDNDSGYIESIHESLEDAMKTLSVWQTEYPFIFDYLSIVRLPDDTIIN